MRWASTRVLPRKASATICTRKCVSPSGRAPAWPLWRPDSSITSSSTGAKASVNRALILSAALILPSFRRDPLTACLVARWCPDHNRDDELELEIFRPHPHQPGWRRQDRRCAGLRVAGLRQYGRLSRAEGPAAGG